MNIKNKNLLITLFLLGISLRAAGQEESLKREKETREEESLQRIRDSKVLQELEDLAKHLTISDRCMRVAVQKASPEERDRAMKCIIDIDLQPIAGKKVRMIKKITNKKGIDLVVLRFFQYRDKFSDTLKFLPLSEKNTLLCRYSAEGKLEVVRCLVKAGAAVNAKDEDDTPLMKAAHHGYTEVVELLLAQNPTVLIEEAREKAEKQGHDGIVKLISEFLKKKSEENKKQDEVND